MNLIAPLPQYSMKIGYFFRKPLLHLITDSNAWGGGVGNITDWSRSARNKRKLMYMGDHDDQTFITDYYSILDNIQQLYSK